MKPNKTTPAALLLTLLAGSTQTLALDLACMNKTPALTGFVLNGIDADDRSGVSVSAAGDVNGDGIDDIILAAPYANPNGLNNAGESYVIFGDTSIGSTDTFLRSVLDGTNGFVINGAAPGDSSGRCFSSGGDVNGDGIDDLLIGAMLANPNGFNGAGACFVVFGAVDIGASGTVELGSLDGTDGFVLNGIDTGDRAGRSVSCAGDFNDDGVDDLLIGASRADPDANISAGESYIVLGGQTVGASGSMELSSLNGSNGFVINGANAGDFSGRAVSSAGDLNNDGIKDILIGADLANAPGGLSGEGESYVVFGRAGVGSTGTLDLDSINFPRGFTIYGVDAGDHSGGSVSSAGDINSDGIDDIIIGANAANPNGNGDAGESYVVFGHAVIGAAGGELELSDLDGSNGFVLNGINSADRSGVSVSSPGDVNGDGIDDLIIGAYRADPNGNFSAGESYVVFGGIGIGAGANLELDKLNGINGFVLNGVFSDDLSGKTVSSAGDINADGFADLLVAAERASPHGKSEAGQTYVIFGSPTLGQTILQDLNANGCVDATDLAQLLAAWSTPDADLNADGTTNSADLAILLAAWTG